MLNEYNIMYNSDVSLLKYFVIGGELFKTDELGRCRRVNCIESDRPVQTRTNLSIMIHCSNILGPTDNGDRDGRRWLKVMVGI